MFIAKVIKAQKGVWSDDALQFIEKFKLGPKSGIKHGYITIIDSDIYRDFYSKFRSIIEFEKEGSAIFTKEELELSDNILLHNFGPDLCFPARLSEDDDGTEYLKYAFGEVCSKCNIPLSEQVRPITLEKEPRLSKKHIWGSFHGVSKYVFTDIARYKVLHTKWGLRKRELLLGSKQRVSKEYVQLEIPLSPSSLCFGESYFGRTFLHDGSGELSTSHVNCPECKRPLYTNSILDFFPKFQEESGFNIVFTQEWFGWYRHTVVSGNFLHWLIENKFVKLHTNFLTPIKDFCKVELHKKVDTEI